MQKILNLIKIILSIIIFLAMTILLCYTVAIFFVPAYDNYLASNYSINGVCAVAGLSIAGLSILYALKKLL